MLTRSHTLLASALIALCGLTNVWGQAPSQPDYSNVNDILNGHRSLLQVDDLVAGQEVLKTSGNTQIKDSDIYRIPVADPKGHNGLQILARIFDSLKDTLVYTNSNYMNTIDPVTQMKSGILFPVDAGEFDYAAAATGDFTSDNFSEVAIASATGVRIISAVDIHDPSKGIRSGPVYSYSRQEDGGLTDLGVTIGDFDGDGQRELALLYHLPQPDSGYLPTLAIFKVDPQTLQLAVVSQTRITKNDYTVFRGRIAAGKFGAITHDQLVVGYAYGNNSFTVQSFDFNGSFDPVLKDAANLPFDDLSLLNGSSTVAVLKADHFDPASPFKQVAVKTWTAASRQTIQVLTFDANLRIHVNTGQVNVSLDGSINTSDLAVGNFDQAGDSNPSDPSAPGPSFKKQLAFIAGNTLYIFNVEPPNGPSQDFTISSSPALQKQINPGFLTIAAGDTQGRSLLLGEPSKYVIEKRSQPTVVVAAPPMHVDFVSADPKNRATPELLNLTVVPDSYHTQYQVESDSRSESSNTHTSSWSFGASETVEEGYKIGIPDLADISVTDKFVAQQTWKGSVENQNSSYQAQSFSVSDTTGFGDHIWLDESRLNIYVYPVLGRLVCPVATSNCATSEKKPMTIQFSAPDKTSLYDVTGSQDEQYQPAWEPGNIFSYPANYSQLQLLIPTLEQISQNLNFVTDDGSLSYQATWSQGANQSQSTSFDQNYSFDNTFSVSAEADLEVESANASASLQLSGSYALTNLNTSTNNIGKSTGIQIQKPSTFAEPFTYAYGVSPFIFGNKKPPSATHDLPATGDIQIYGTLQSAFTADPLSSNAGGWWKEEYSRLPDVALNHPTRWDHSQPSLSTPLPSNCLAVGNGSSQMYCVTLSKPNPTNPWLSAFHNMRGFFISSANNPGQGPQIITAKAGEQLYLQTRVYNYSLKAMDPGTVVHTRFYLQRMDQNNNCPIGDSVLIGESTIGAIPPFDDPSGAPLNWVLTGVPFDTTKYANQEVAFWVLAWMEDGNGHLLPELESHGLKSIPGNLKSLADVPIEEYSNNVGFYKSAFYIAPAKLTSPSSKTSSESAELHLGKAQISPPGPVQIGDSIAVSAALQSGEQETFGTTILFYEGDPRAGGKAFDVERIAHVGAQESHQVLVRYQPETCGTHEIFLVLRKDQPDEIIRRAAPIRVSCSGVIGFPSK